MKTVVYQSYRTSAVPAWIARCMDSVRAWAQMNGFDYRFIDDRLFDYAPAWYREKVRQNKLLISDLARLKLARELLDSGYQRAIWMDADLLVFEPLRASFELPHGYAFCREVWLWRQPDGKLSLWDRANNCVSVFDQGNPMLEFLIHAAEALVRNAQREVRTIELGTELLSTLNERIGLPLLRHIGMFSPHVMHALVAGDAELLRAFMARVAEPLVAGNLCGSFREAGNHGSVLEESVYDRAVEMLLQSRGQALNLRLSAPQGA